MNLEELIPWAHQQGASDLHFEPGLPAAVRIRGTLKTFGPPIPASALAAVAQDFIGQDWPNFEARRSYDMSRTVQGIRCRINVLRTSRGIGFAIRLLTSFSVTLEKLNLHPDLRRLVAPHQGLVIVTGATGSGKSTTLAALIQEVNLTEARHIVTIESPIEFTFKPHRSYIRQREVGRDTPSFEQALTDALREDPDLLMVGEMRDPETMRLTLNASETGHLVLVTMHSGTCAEALQRLVSAFPPEIQGAVCGQLADCLVGVIAQRLRYRPDLDLRIPECEILTASIPIRHAIRSREFFKIAQHLETSAEHGMWTFQRYENWLQKKSQWQRSKVERDADGLEAPTSPPIPNNLNAPIKPQSTIITPRLSSPMPQKPTPKAVSPLTDSRRIEIIPEEGGFDSVLKRLVKEPDSEEGARGEGRGTRDR